MRIDCLDHLVLTVADIDATSAFYSSVLGMRVVTFGDNRKALAFGTQKINLHLAGREFEPKAVAPTPGAADLCFLTAEPLDRVVEHLRSCGEPVIEGPVVRTGATGPIQSVYIRDPDGNLIEIANQVNSPNAKSHAGAVAEELRKFQGAWRQVSWEKDGVTEPPEEQGWDPVVTFTGDAFVVTLADGSIAIKGSFKLDPTQKPKAIDWTDTFGPDAGKTLPAIYSLEGDRLVFCVADEGQERPTEFRTRPGLVLRVNQREKP